MSTPYSRIRYRSVPKSSPLSGLTKGRDASFPDIITPSFVTVSGYDNEHMSDVVTPDWSQRRGRGEIVNNSMNFVKDSLTYASSDLHHIATHPSYAAFGYPEVFYTGCYGARLDAVPSLGIPSVTSDSIAPLEIDEEHFIKLAGIKARIGVSPILVQSLVSLVELPKTIRLITSSLSTIRQIRKSVVTGNPDYALRAIGNQRRGKVSVSANFSRKTIHDRWLEFRYGWTPLVFEVQGAVKALNRPRVATPPRATSRGFEKTSSQNTVFHDWNSGSTGIYRFRYTREKTLSVRAYVLYTADLKYQQARDFGVSEFPLAAWELVPFSFVVDWFVNIGNWIEALTPKLGIKILAEGYVVKSTNSLLRTVESWTKTFPGGNSYDSSGGFHTATDVRLTSKTSRVPHLNALYSYPPLNIKIDKKRALDAIALISKSF